MQGAFSRRCIFGTPACWTTTAWLAGWPTSIIQHLFTCASISWFQAVSGWVSDLPFSASASTGLSDYFCRPAADSILMPPTFPIASLNRYTPNFSGVPQKLTWCQQFGLQIFPKWGDADICRLEMAVFRCFFGQNKFSRPNGRLSPIACLTYLESYGTYNLGYQKSISVHPTRRQNFAGKVYSVFPNIWEWVINRWELWSSQALRSSWLWRLFVFSGEQKSPEMKKNLPQQRRVICYLHSFKFLYKFCPWFFRK